MPTRARIDLAGYHHVINRGANKKLRVGRLIFTFNLTDYLIVF